ncbi:hypothetical protein TorRG33x02_042770 [Trema orientale]|uniref:Pollen Ole e 1 allergen and extensin family protein n=1 Tax=Trema orientale TaxID=63057 RepID=A0A2P5FPX9_TREOI|nr:hypothetical protein TorRG33x02_042770 [Trema orientale]
MSWVAHSVLPNHKPPADAPSHSNNDPLARVRIAGVLRCRVAPRNPPIIEPLVAGVNVVLSCDGGSTVIADTVTNTDGFFEVVVDSASSILFGGSNTSNCKIKPRLPIAGCSVSVPTGVVSDPLGDHQTIIDKLFGNNVISNANDHVVDTGKSYYDPSTVHDDHVVHNQDHN